MTNDVAAHTAGGVACVGFHKSAYCEYLIDCSFFGVCSHAVIKIQPHILQCLKHICARYVAKLSACSTPNTHGTIKYNITN